MRHNSSQLCVQQASALHMRVKLATPACYMLLISLKTETLNLHDFLDNVIMCMSNVVAELLDIALWFHIHSVSHLH